MLIKRAYKKPFVNKLGQTAFLIFKINCIRIAIYLEYMCVKGYIFIE